MRRALRCARGSALLILFAIGFTAMSRFVRNTGAFHAYAAAGLGKPVGVGVACITVVAYGFLCICFYALLGFYANLTFAHLFGIELHWGVWACVSALIIGVLGYRRIDVGAKVLAVLLTAEIAILLVISIAFLAIFYAFTFWALTAALGVDGVIALANSDDFEEMMFIAGENALGAWAGVVMEILIVTSFFACALAFHNACARYLFSLGRERLLPGVLARTHPKMKSPHVASIALTALSLIAMIVGAVSGADLFLGIGLWSYAIGVAGLIFSQGVAAVSVIGFFWKDRRGYGIWRVVVAPILGALGLLSAFVVILRTLVD